MKKFVLLIYLLLIISCIFGCAKTIYHKDYFDPQTGAKIASEDLTMSRPIFASMNAGATNTSGTINMTSGSSIQLDQLMSLALQGYAKYMSGGLMSTPTPTAGPLVTEVTP